MSTRPQQKRRPRVGAFERSILAPRRLVVVNGEVVEAAPVAPSTPAEKPLISRRAQK